MTTTLAYLPLIQQIPAKHLRTDTRRYLRYAELSMCDADSPTRPHTYGVCPWSCPAIATEPCRPTACVRERPCSPNGEDGLGKTPSYRASAPNGAGDVGSRSTVHCSLLTVHWSYTFSAKEKDSETGLSYFGSRYYSSDLSIWLSVDPMSDKYASLSPYTYCANNPVKLVDPNGEEVWIIGDDVDGALNQLQNQTGLKLSISDDGQLSYKGEIKTEIDKMIANAIDDENITVNMIANISNTFGDVTTEVGGGYMGNTYEDGHVCTDQFVSTSLLADFDLSVGDAKTGLTMVHELAESYYGGQMALQRKESSPISGVGCTYNEAHLKANKIAVGNRGPVDVPVLCPGVSFKSNKPGDDIHRMRNGVIDYSHIYVRIGWERRTNKNGM